MDPYLVLSGTEIILASLCLLASLLPLVPVPHGSVRSFDFTRLPVISLSVAVLVMGLVGSILSEHSPSTLLLISFCMAGLAMLIQVGHILPFTPLWRKQTARFHGNPKQADTLSLLVCNVKQGNRDFDRVAKLIADKTPDIAIFMETDEDWASALMPHLSDFAHVIARPQSNTYGMLLASRRPLEEGQVRFLLNDQVPSITCKIRTPSGRFIRLVALHPEPPIPIRDTMGRDAEILMVGKIAREETLPMIVTGDLNDVAWSCTTRRFLRLSRLLDPRQGRGLFNTFDARRWYLRWPLDHVFHSRDFELVDMERQPFVGSDHFPMFYRFALVESDRNSLPEEADHDDLNEANKLIKAEKGRNRTPVGADWE
ncbi:endonuclease/exonuclease/phosphatase family protein [uncultured Cohaesibacter sp.]|uniref:endonuclease/exonuclease/phosphatase family protein n=1 Tax=uncultured Cohaesibacter sp. TaxID=1002546 RepID=UPI0029C6DC26|nr:endonuclease/exonuclease/phosphatase family protein [uncultured Cohaesibacter sp.]